MPALTLASVTGFVRSLLFIVYGSLKRNLKQLALVPLRGYREELLGIKSYDIRRGLGLVWGAI